MSQVCSVKCAVALTGGGPHDGSVTDFVLPLETAPVDIDTWSLFGADDTGRIVGIGRRVRYRHSSSHNGDRGVLLVYRFVGYIDCEGA
jgi:hypothetical protein